MRRQSARERDRERAGAWDPPSEFGVLYVPEARHYLTPRDHKRAKKAHAAFLETGVVELFDFVDIYGNAWQMGTDKIEAVGYSTLEARARARLYDDELGEEAGEEDPPSDPEEAWRGGNDGS